jgi:signal transduction histidine kinase
MVENLREVAFQLNDTVETLTEVIKIRHQSNIASEKVSFTGILQKLKTMLQVQISNASAQISYNFEEADAIEYPKAYMESIMQNLLTNAIKYRHPERAPQIHFHTSLNNNSIVLTCSDNGLGMDLNKVGHKLFGLNRTFHRHPDARGVGLFITKNQVEALGGSIEVESTPDIGSTFRVSFKLH